MNRVKLTNKFRIATAGLIFLAGGCSVGPNYQKPDLPVPAGWQEAQQKRRRYDVRGASSVVDQVQ